jgi:hypothetical protein
MNGERETDVKNEWGAGKCVRQKQNCSINEWKYTHNNQHPPARLFCGRTEMRGKKLFWMAGRQQHQTEPVGLLPRQGWGFNQTHGHPVGLSIK